ncbi:hypothetical protein WJ97_12135 [Burkholderia ubonensis]|uniref:hypothetical protein n=1 Tax=Burkholderia ubonensis TaxID=101571 RepID=UPI00075D689C|nr:hypothetical protein [Burkholderia ubonensis]KVP96626.1 hypothetical protein WJ97_12135 [Burkholderia ubonensis]
MTHEHASLILDVDPFLRRCGLPCWTWAQIRRLRVGQQLQLVNFLAPGLCATLDGGATVTIERMRGGIYRLEAAWLAHLGKNAKRRGHLWVWVDFKMLTGRRLELIPSKSATRADSHTWCLRLIEVVLRRAGLLALWAKREGDSDAFGALMPCLYRHRHGQDDGAMAWLEKRRGPPL